MDEVSLLIFKKIKNEEIRKIYNITRKNKTKQNKTKFENEVIQFVKNVERRVSEHIK